MHVQHRIHMKSTWNKCYIIPSNKELFIYRLILINDGEETSSIDRIIYLYAGNVSARSEIRCEFVEPHMLLLLVVVIYSQQYPNSSYDHRSSKRTLFHSPFKLNFYRDIASDFHPRLNSSALETVYKCWYRHFSSKILCYTLSFYRWLWPMGVKLLLGKSFGIKFLLGPKFNSYFSLSDEIVQWGHIPN